MADDLRALVCLIVPTLAMAGLLVWLLYGLHDLQVMARRMFRSWIDRK